MAEKQCRPHEHIQNIQELVHKTSCGFAFVETGSIPLKRSASISAAYVFFFAHFADESASRFEVLNSPKKSKVWWSVVGVSVLASQHFLLTKTFDQTATYQ